MSFPTYEQYKESGFQWLGMVPDAWEVNISRRYFYEIREPGKYDDIQLSATQKFGVVPQTMFMDMEDQKVVLALKGLSNFKHVEPDDFVISLRSFQGGIERSKYQGCVSPAYTVLRPKKLIDPNFISYVFKSTGYIDALQSVTDGIREGKNIKYDQFANLGLVLPSVDEQKKIVTFLDHETAKIDNLVAEQKKLIELLKEKGQAVISQAVTKGLDPTVKMKDSGIKWLGEVPEHWSIERIRRFVKLNPSKSELGILDKTTEVSFLPMEAIGEEGTLSLEKTKPLSEVETGYTYFREGDVTVAKITPCFENGKGAVMKGLHNGFGFGTTELIVARPTEGKVIADFLYRLFSSSHFRKNAEGSMYGAGGQKRVSDDFIREFQTGLPPVNEQIEIAEFIDYETVKFESLIKEATSVITLLNERRSALITAAVTGQIDVRNYQPKEVA